MGIGWWEIGYIDYSRRRMEGEGQEPYDVLSSLLAARAVGVHDRH